MKVLFAVSNDEISESIVRRYQKEYKEIISYKNVYYFNAILKEIQKDKSYDRIVISEELEAFTNTQYDQIDKFIFEKLDSISDEASNQRGDNTPIILICSDRRTKSEEMLIKLFGIGIYDAIMGNDRSIEEVCKLINKPRSKKEAKIYYAIDADEVKYQAENENDVSEQEIQNILAHYKKLGKNEDKYVASFNNIVAQYNDAQLRIISKFLPLNVRAVLEEKSPKYQQIMSFNNSVTNNIRRAKKEENLGPSEKLLKPKNQNTSFSGPIVIPSSVNSGNVKKLTRTPNPISQPVQTTNNIAQDLEEMFVDDIKPVKKQTPVDNSIANPTPKRRGRPRKNPLPENNILPGVNNTEKEPEEDDMILPGFEDINNVTTSSNNSAKKLKYIDEEPILPGFENINSAEQQIRTQEDNTTILPGFETVKNKYNQPNAFENINNYQNSVNTYQEPENIFENTNNYEEQTNTIENNYNSYEEQNNVLHDNFSQQNSYTGMVNQYDTNNYEQSYNQPQMEDLSRLLTGDKKIATFVGTSKNGTSFIVNNIAEYASSIGINVAVLDTTKNKNSYYIYTKNEEELRQTAGQCLENLINGQAKGISVSRNLTVYTSLPEDRENLNNVSQILETLVRRHNLVLIDSDFDSPMGYFSEAQEIYLVQSLDILTIQPLTAFLRELKAHNILDQNKLKIILNKYVKVRGISEKTIIGGMSKYNDPAMSFMTDLFDVATIDYRTIGFEQDIYTRYLESIINCDVSIKGYSKTFMQTLKEISNWIYPMMSGNSTYRPPAASSYSSTFSSDINNTLNQMKRKY